MRIEHVAMYVNELEAARDFFVKYLGGVSKNIIGKKVLLSKYIASYII